MHVETMKITTNTHTNTTYMLMDSNEIICNSTIWVFELDEKERLERAMEWVGMYIAAASAICILAMAADAFNGFRRNKLWFPCYYFSLNPASLALLGIAMKLAMDLTAVMRYIRMAKITTLIFLSTAMGNFMSSLGSMDDKHVVENVVALAILVITVIADVIIRFLQTGLTKVYIGPLVLMLLSLVTVVSMAIAVPKTKKILEMKYQERHRLALKEEEEGFLNLTFDGRKRYMMKYWVMAATSNPQFVMARSVVCTSSAFICLIALITLPTAYVRLGIKHKGPSVYGSSVDWILYTQTVGVAVGTIAPMLRWFVVIRFKCYTGKRLREEFKIERYWIQTLMDLRESLSDFKFGIGKLRKCLHNTKWFAITFLIGLQITFVFFSKLLVSFSALLMAPFFLLFSRFSNTDPITSNSNQYSPYVLLLEGEAELPRTTLNNICSEADNTIQTCRKQQPKHLITLLSKSVSFKGVNQFDSQQIPSLSSQEPPNCWTLPIVTLTSIAIAVPHIEDTKRKHLLSSVSQGLTLAKQIQKKLTKHDGRGNIRDAADMCWVRVVLYMKWLDIYLTRARQNSKEMLEELTDKSRSKVMEHLNKQEKGPGLEDPSSWPAEVIAANSMYRISRSIAFLNLEDEGDDELFEQVSVMIADIMAACFTNLPKVITRMCQRNEIEKRERSVRKAFLLLGRTEQIVEALQKKEWPCMDDNGRADIEKWRALFRQSESASATLGLVSTYETAVAIV